ncbi:hypothetical protein GCM10008910_26410 [Faecalicatena orotica]|uniref:Uncharacterized protein n=1 Tax=Faecalicatena orotica TaxID=1544 RepID=A0A2Y9CAP8_9FIRM|nr:hypothetical protein [Faecalicatena orotica]PWJ22552.1 hypothetical protein A8806_1187 [Faecalicatena orotica]SSA58221.1 hypothetical protein SAMN05216536_1187 [Faecalicatena orotica]
MKYLENKAIGFYFSILGAVLALAGIIVYRQAKNTEPLIMTLLAAVVLLQAAAVVFLAFVRGRKAVNLVIMADAVLVAAALVLSFRTQVDALGYVVSGLYGFETVKSYVFSAVFMLISLIMYWIASYHGFEKEAM